jgi:hypothetical protein
MADAAAHKKPNRRLFWMLGVGVVLIAVMFGVPQLLLGGDGAKSTVPPRARTTPTTVVVDAGPATGGGVGGTGGPAARDPFQPQG